MADEQQQQQGSKGANLPKVNYLSAASDDYEFEIKMPPRKPFDQQQGMAQQSGGMASQFDTVSSGVNNSV